MEINFHHNEKELLQQVSEGDEAAFQSIFIGYYDRLFHYVSGFTKSKQVTEELVMDVFLKIWLGRALLPKINHFDSFLFRVAHNKSIDFLRAIARDPLFKDLLWDQIQFTNNDHSDSRLMVHEYEKKLREAIGLLSPQRKKVYQLSREEDMNHDQIAAKLNLSKYTVNNHIVEAQKFIRNYLSKNLDLTYLMLIAQCQI
ncbi:MAG: sigma-70 family RNA polymerase sigma factor [Ginsengibacter sp.]